MPRDVAGDHRRTRSSVMFGNEWNCNCPGSYALGATCGRRKRPSGSVYNPNWQTQVTWTRPATNRLLLEAGNVIVNGKLNVEQFAGSVADPYVLDSSRNYALRQLVVWPWLERRSGLQHVSPGEPEVRRVVRNRLPFVQDRHPAHARVARRVLLHGSGEELFELRLQRA